MITRSHIVKIVFFDKIHIMEVSKRMKDQVFTAVLLGTIFWAFYGTLFHFFMPPEYFDYRSWAIVIIIDVICIVYYLIFKSNISAIDCFTKVITMIQISYCLYQYDLHIVYLFSMVGLFSVTMPTFVSSESKYIYVYALTSMLCGASLLFSSSEYKILIGIGCIIGPLFSAILTITNKKTRDENVKMKVELEQAKIYAHEINNPLVVVKAGIDQLLKKSEYLDQEDIDRLVKAQKNIDRITDILKEARERFLKE